MLKVGIVGATGYTGEELVRIISRHSNATITSLTAVIDKPAKISQIFPSLAGRCDVVCKELDVDEVSKACDLVFLALPHKVSMKYAGQFLKNGKKVIDLSADYRLTAAMYEKWYDAQHTDWDNLKEAVYGLPELYREKIKKAQLIANPGCYPTSVILGSIPIIKQGIAKVDTIIADSKSGATGAGRKAALALCFSEVNESLKAYRVNTHQHKPEINQEMAKLTNKVVDVIFTPHLVPMNRGILSTIYFKLKKEIDTKELVSVYRKFYRTEPFVRVSSERLPETRDVVNTNYCNIGVTVTGSMAIVVSCIDNLIKGAAGQAAQNMNIMCGFDEKEGLIT
ncbi:MAG: N-acetyl-gamma-glutamyl-phosphate reductase [Candidatus Omnitrophota bacterium]